MPALHAFGRHWHLASDDLFIPCILGVIYCSAWLGLTSYSVSRTVDTGVTQTSQSATYYIALLSFLALLLFLHGILGVHSLQGSILEADKRKYVPALVHAMLLVYVALTSLNAWGTWLLWYKSVGTTTPGDRVVPQPISAAIINGTWAALACAFASLCLLYNLFPQYDSETAWHSRSQCVAACLCSLSTTVTSTKQVPGLRGNLSCLQFIALTLHHVLGSEELCFTDYVYSLMLVAIWQRPHPTFFTTESKRHSISLTASFPKTVCARSEALLTTESISPEKEQHTTTDPARTCCPTPVQIGMRNACVPPSLLQELKCTPPQQQELPSSTYQHQKNKKRIPCSWKDVIQPVPAQPCNPTKVASVLHDAVHYHCHAMAAYGWPMYVWAHRRSPVGAVWRCCCGTGCCCCHDGHKVWASEGCISTAGLDINRKLHVASIVKVTGLGQGQLLYISDRNECQGLLPCFLVANHARREVILSIRGSFSGSDGMTDLFWYGKETVEDQHLREWQQEDCSSDAQLMGAGGSQRVGQRSGRLPPLSGADLDGKCHAGMLECARQLQKELEPLLCSLLVTRSQSPQHGQATNTRKTVQDLSSYQLVITGHSLGAGVAAILGILLRSSFPTLRVWAFAPPGGLLCPSVSRLSVPATLQLLERAYCLAAQCRVSKAKLLWAYVRGHRLQAQDVFHVDEESMSEHVKQQLKLFIDRVQDRQAGDFSQLIHTSGRLVPPGKVLLVPHHELDQASSPHPPSCLGGTIVPDPSPAYSQKNGQTYKSGASRQLQQHVYWVEGRDLADQGLIACPDMFWDHVPDKQLTVLEQVLKRCHTLEQGNLKSTKMLEGTPQQLQQQQQQHASRNDSLDGDFLIGALHPPHIQHIAADSNVTDDATAIHLASSRLRMGVHTPSQTTAGQLAGSASQVET